VLNLYRQSDERITGSCFGAASTHAGMIGALESRICGSDLGDFFGRCFGLTMTG
jgi:hypothetical protein